MCFRGLLGINPYLVNLENLESVHICFVHYSSVQPLPLKGFHLLVDLTFELINKLTHVLLKQFCEMLIQSLKCEIFLVKVELLCPE